MDAWQGWLDARERKLASAEVVGELEQMLPLLLTVSWTVLLLALQQHVRSAMRGWVLPRLQAGSLQLLLVLALAAVPPSAAGLAGEPSAFGMLSAMLLTGFAQLLTGISLPHRAVVTCVPLADLRAHLAHRRAGLRGLSSWRMGAVAAILLLVLRPVAALLWLLPRGGAEMEPSGAMLDMALLAAGSVATWLAGNECRRELLGDHLPHYGLVYYCVGSLCWAWELQTLLVTCLAWSSESFALLETAKVFEAAVAAAGAAAALATERDPLVQMALTRRRSGASAAESEDLLRECCGSWRARGEAVASTLDALQPLQEMAEAPTPRRAVDWQPLGEGMEACADSEEEADLRAQAEAQVCSLPLLEAQRGRGAWRAWSVCSGVHPYWMGVQDRGGARKVISPLRLTEQEQVLYEEGKLRQRSTWQYVLVDLFTDRVQSKPLAVIVVVIAASYAYRLDFAGKLAEHLPNPALVVAANIGILAVLWLLVGLALLGNNPFLCCRWAYSLWAMVLGTLLLVLSGQHCLRILPAVDTTELREQQHEGAYVEELEERWFDFCMAFLALLGCFLAFRVAAQPQGRSDFHRSEMNALWYASDLLRPPGAVLDLRKRPPEAGEELIFVARHAEGDLPAVAEKDHGNGTCDIRLRDGRRYHSVRHKHLERRAREGQVAEERADKRLRRLKRILSAAEEYPPTLFFGAAATVPLVLMLACGMLQAVKGVLHRIYQVHVAASLLNFCLFAYVVPGGSPQQALSGQASLAQEAAPALYFRWDDGTSPGAWPSTPCEDLALGDKLLYTLSWGGNSEALTLTWADVSGSVDSALDSWGLLSGEAPQPARATLHHAWRSFLGGQDRVRLNGADLGKLICEAKLEFGSPHLTTLEELAYAVAWDVAMAVKRKCEGGELIRGHLVHRVARMAAKWLRQELQLAGLGKLVRELGTLADAFTKDPGGIPHLGGQLKNFTKTVLQILDMWAPSVSAQARPYLKGASQAHHIAKEVAPVLVRQGDESHRSAPTELADGALQGAPASQANASVPAGRRLKAVQEARRGKEEHSRDLLRELQGIVSGNELDAHRLLRLGDRDGDGQLGFEDDVPVVLELAEEACEFGRCGTNLEGRLWAAFVRADWDGDGRASLEELHEASKRLRAILTRRDPGPGRGGEALCKDGGFGRGPGAGAEALRLLDTDGDGVLSVDEALQAVKAMTSGSPRPSGEEAGRHVSPAGLLMAAFARDDGDADGSLSRRELEEGSFATTLANACPTPSSATVVLLPDLPAASAASGSHDATAGHLEAAVEAAAAKVEGPTTGPSAAAAAESAAATTGRASTTAAAAASTTGGRGPTSTPSVGAATGVVAVAGRDANRSPEAAAAKAAAAAGGGSTGAGPTATDGDGDEEAAAAVLLGSPVAGAAAAVIGILQQDWVVWALIGLEAALYISLFCGVICEFHVVGRCFTKYRRLFEEMQAGSHHYLGHRSRASLEKGFAESAVLPGVLLGTVAIGFVLVVCMVFLLIPAVVLLCLPMCGPQWLAPLVPALKYLLLALALKKIIQLALLDWLLVDEGEVVYPGIFSLFWFIQLFLNFVIGIPAAAARAMLVLGIAGLSCCLVDVTLMPESLVSLDAAYYSLLALVYTRHDRRNPLKVAGTAAFLRRAHRAYGPVGEATATDQLGSKGKDQLQRRVRARLWLAVTLHRNPELQAMRRRGSRPA